MLQSVTIKHFRGFRELHLNSLKRVNLILGQNNVGKTALLEALASLLSENPIDFQALASKFRASAGDPNEDFFKWLFFNRDTAQPLYIGLKAEKLDPFEIVVALQGVKIDRDSGLLKPRGTFNGYFIYNVGGRMSAGFKAHVFSTQQTDPRKDAIDFNRVILRRRKKQVEDLLRKIEPRLQSIESIQTSTMPLLYADIGLPEMIPVTQLGQGFNRLLDIYSELVAAEAKVLLIDEIENGLHHSVLETVWSGLFSAATELDVQIFATTHSWECVLAADKAASKSPSDDLNLIRLDRVENDVKATEIDRAAFETAKELHWEMR